MGNRKNVTGAEQARALKIIDAIPDTLGKQLALRETLNLAGDANTRADLAMSAMTRNPSLHVEGLKTLADLAKFPFTTKADLRANYPFGMFAVPRNTRTCHPLIRIKVGTDWMPSFCKSGQISSEVASISLTSYG
jgi:hypothetical protein